MIADRNPFNSESDIEFFSLTMRFVHNDYCYNDTIIYNVRKF